MKLDRIYKSLAKWLIQTKGMIAVFLSVPLLSGCAGALRKILAIGDHGVEKFVRGKGGAVVFFVSAAIGVYLLAMRGQSAADTTKRRLFGAILFGLGVSIMLIRYWLSFHYVGRQTPY